MCANTRLILSAAAAALVFAAGCANYNYHFGSSVPEELRTITVPVFENGSGFPEIDAIVTQYVLREIQREGTFAISPPESASLKLLGKLRKTDLQPIVFDRNYSARASEYRYTLVAEITLVERGSGKLLLNAVPVKASTTFITRGDMLTGLQDAYPRVAKELARSIVDMVLANW